MDAALKALIVFIAAVGPMAIFVTKATDFVRNVADKSDTAPKWVWNAVPFALGVGVALLWQFNFIVPVIEAVPALAKGSTRLVGVWGQLLTGLGIGAVASGWHEKFDALSSQAKVDRAATPSGTQS